jgi:hypothetical protein
MINLDDLPADLKVSAHIFAQRIPIALLSLFKLKTLNAKLEKKKIWFPM